MYRCPRCGNIDKKYIGFNKNVPYCRKCIKFKNSETLTNSSQKSKEVTINMKYGLTNSQDLISNELLNNIDKEKHILVYAVCGAGKTEIIVEEITPDKGDMVTMAITNPTIIVEFSRYQENIIIKNTEGQIFEKLN